ncbi:unannotated protein [freshwater metagenome]|uniref:Unannotated protein n=1 Tax=freshwater metagenome TaxID=449393 RepID=A0A6J7G1K7_9ZZZZ
MIDDELHWCNTSSLCYFANCCARMRFVIDVGSSDRVHAVQRFCDEPIVETVGWYLAHESCPSHWVFERGNAIGKWQVSNFVICGVGEQWMHAALEAHQDANGPSSGLSNYLLSIGMCLREQRKSFAPHFAAVIQLIDVDTDSGARAAREFLHPRPFVNRHARMFG